MEQTSAQNNTATAARLTREQLQAYRRETYALTPENRLHTADDAVDFVNRRGFVFFWPIRDIECPSLWTATAGDRPVADEHDDPGHVTWGWKDELLGARRWYYAKVLRKKSTMVSLHVAPYFYALTENYGSPEDDYLTLYEQGRLSQEAKAVYEALLDNGPLHTIDLRNTTHMNSSESNGRFNKALLDLQADFKILPVGVAHAGAWNYAFIYDITARFYPELQDQAHEISEKSARQKLAGLYLQSVGAASVQEVSKLFGWSQNHAAAALDSLAASGALIPNVELEASRLPVYTLSSLL